MTLKSTFRFLQPDDVRDAMIRRAWRTLTRLAEPSRAPSTHPKPNNTKDKT